MMAPDDPRHGTHNGYGNLRCRCQPCRDAWANYLWRSRRHRGRVLGPCTKPGCPGRPQYARGICRACYEWEQRFIRKGLPVPAVRS